MNLIYPMSTGEPAVAGIGYLDNRHPRDPAESINGNMGDPADDVKGSGSNGLVTVLKTSDASEGSQRGHSTQSAGKPRTGGSCDPFPRNGDTPGMRG